MTTLTQQQIIDYAILSAAVYNDARLKPNLITVPDSWNNIVKSTTNAQGLGFAATAYQNGNNIVISYEGTDINNIPNIIAARVGRNSCAYCAVWNFLSTEYDAPFRPTKYYAT
jgi:hypothetical protein